MLAKVPYRRAIISDFYSLFKHVCVLFDQCREYISRKRNPFPVSRCCVMIRSSARKHDRYQTKALVIIVLDLN